VSALRAPAGPGTNAFEQFCAFANMFCDITHLQRSRDDASDPPERPLELSDAAAFGGDDWAGYAANDSSHLAAATRQAGHG
jgi:hypothetical protein